MSSWFRYTAIGLVVVIVLMSGLFLTGFGQALVLSTIAFILGPDGTFDPATAPPAPDYADPRHWAALPFTEDPADLIPDGIDDRDIQGDAPADVFFIHPTGYHKGASWVSPMDADSATEENTLWMLANQASAFNGCCNVYAPRYREATIFAYMAADEAEREAILDFVYEDVAAAFEYYLARYGDGRPFVIAAHSQGTHHGLKLLQRMVDGTALADRLVAAYLIGSVHSPVARILAALDDVRACDGPLDLGCVVHFDTYGDGGSEIAVSEEGLCTNPLSWRTDGTRISAEYHLGAVPVTGLYSADYGGDDRPLGQRFDYLAAPITMHTWAECRGDALYVANQSATDFAAFAPPGGARSYHGLDYPLFHMNIRENAVARVQAFLGYDLP